MNPWSQIDRLKQENESLISFCIGADFELLPTVSSFYRARSKWTQDRKRIEIAARTADELREKIAKAASERPKR